jgi:hypothetical protein
MRGHTWCRLTPSVDPCPRSPERPNDRACGRPPRSPIVESPSGRGARARPIRSAGSLSARLINSVLDDDLPSDAVDTSIRKTLAATTRQCRRHWRANDEQQIEKTKRGRTINRHSRRKISIHFFEAISWRSSRHVRYSIDAQLLWRQWSAQFKNASLFDLVEELSIARILFN